MFVVIVVEMVLEMSFDEVFMERLEGSLFVVYDVGELFVVIW